MRQFLSFFRQFLKPLANSNTCIFVHIALKMNCGILKSKLILCEWNAFYFIETAFIGFTLDEIKQCIVFFGTPGIYRISVYFSSRYNSEYQTRNYSAYMTKLMSLNTCVLHHGYIYRISVFLVPGIILSIKQETILHI